MTELFFLQRVNSFFDAGKIAKNRPREQNLRCFADRGGRECWISPLGIVYEKIGRKMIPGYAKWSKTDLCDRA